MRTCLLWLAANASNVPVGPSLRTRVVRRSGSFWTNCVLEKNIDKVPRAPNPAWCSRTPHMTIMTSKEKTDCPGSSLQCATRKSLLRAKYLERNLPGMLQHAGICSKPPQKRLHLGTSPVIWNRNLLQNLTGKNMRCCEVGALRRDSISLVSA